MDPTTTNSSLEELHCIEKRGNGMISGGGKGNFKNSSPRLSVDQPCGFQRSCPASPAALLNDSSFLLNPPTQGLGAARREVQSQPPAAAG